MRKEFSILLVEDDPIDIMSVKRAFEHNNVTNPLYVANNGEEGLKILQDQRDSTIKDSAYKISLILLDLKMPRMGGLEMLNIIKKDPDLRMIPVVILTTSDDEQDIQTSFINGAAGYLTKPVTFDKFVQAIKIFNLYWTLSELP